MTDRAPERVAALAGSLVIAATVVLLAGARSGDGASASASEYQRVVGGLGYGAATSLLPCPAAYDRGLAPCCGRALDPAPGGFAFCPHHSGPSIRR